MTVHGEGRAVGGRQESRRAQPLWDFTGIHLLELKQRIPPGGCSHVRGVGEPYTLTVMLNVTMKLVPLLHFLKKTSPVAETKTDCVDKVSLSPKSHLRLSPGISSGSTVFD